MIKMPCLKSDNKVRVLHDSTDNVTATIPSNNEQKQRKQGGKYEKLFKEFTQESSAGGINKIFSSKPAFARAIWATLCIVCYGAMIYLSYTAVEMYLSNPTATFIDVSFESDLPFPSVTICNLNKYRRSKLREIPLVHKVMENFRNKTFNHGSSKNDWQNEDEQKQFYRERMLKRSGLKDTRMDSATVSNVSSRDILELLTLGASARYSQEELKTAGHQFEHLVVDCQWMGISCNTGFLEKYWRHTWNWKYGNCYTFNFGITDGNSTLAPLRTNKPGPTNGLTLDLFIEQHEYIPELSEEAGVRVVIVDGKQHPFPFQEGIAVSPGTATAIALRKEVIERVDRFNNKSCIDDAEHMKSIYNEGAQLDYTIQSCLDTCLVEQQIAECNCSDSRYPSDGSVCSNRVQSECLANVEIKYKSDAYGCVKRCPQRCKSITYRSAISEAQSSSKYMESRRKSLEQKSKFQKYVKTADAFKQDFLRIKIYFEELNLIRIHQEFSYPVSSLLSDIGGQLGLWVGLSVVTFAEFGDLLLSLIILAFSKD